jgi:hypothetical protein
MTVQSCTADAVISGGLRFDGYLAKTRIAPVILLSGSRNCWSVPRITTRHAYIRVPLSQKLYDGLS